LAIIRHLTNRLDSLHAVSFVVIMIIIIIIILLLRNVLNSLERVRVAVKKEQSNVIKTPRGVR
jgi:Na+-transporting NADH:ubiquinone oxidoreductase subunit NqrF